VEIRNHAKKRGGIRKANRVGVEFDKTKKMYKKTNITVLLVSLIGSFLMTSCSKSLLISNGARDNKPLVFNNEYKTSNLEELVVEGSAFCGIPSFSKNNKNNHKNGFIFTFNGVELGKTRRILPILTLIGYSIGSQMAVQRLFGQKTETIDYGFEKETYKTGEYRIGFIPSFIIGLPVAGILNNFTWNNSALSGASATLKYRLVSENPNVDLFYYPKYEINKKNVFSDNGVKLKYLFFQDATLKARVSGATLIHK
jgi:hypothetical protein